MSLEAIQRAINRVERFVGNYTWVLAHDSENDEACSRKLFRAILYEDNIDAVRIVSREFLYNHGCGFMKALLWKMIKLVDNIANDAGIQTFDCSYVMDYY